MTPPSSICAENLTFSSTILHHQQGTWLSPSPRSHIQRHLMNRVLDQTTTVLSSFHRINTLASFQPSHRRDDPRAWPLKLDYMYMLNWPCSTQQSQALVGRKWWVGVGGDNLYDNINNNNRILSGQALTDSSVVNYLLLNLMILSLNINNIRNTSN